MRIGINPEKKDNELVIENYHRVIIPVFIPNLIDDYFKDSLKILKLCLQSLLATIHDKTKITVINNNSCEEVREYIGELYLEHDQFDQFLDSKINLGKVNALNSAIKSNLEPLLTIADSDVMFLTDWQKEAEQILKDFPQCGMVSPVPSVGSLKGAYLKSTLGFAHLRGRLKKENVKNPDGIKNFLRSIGRDFNIEDNELQYHTLTYKNKKAVIGCGHFFATIRASVFEKSPNYPSKFKIVGGSESLYIDQPNDKSGYLKLATLDNYGYHLGNKYEDWMQEALLEINRTPTSKLDNNFDFNNHKPNTIYHWVGSLIQKIFYR